MKALLTDWGILQEYHPDHTLDEINNTDRRIAKSQVKRVYEWGNEPCPHALQPKHSKDMWVKRECSECWQTLLEEAKK